MIDRDHTQPPTAVWRVDSRSAAAQRMSDALWTEIQRRYGFCAPNPFDPDAVAAPRGGFWIAFDGNEPVGSVALAPLGEGCAELDVMYVAPTHRRRKVADALLAAVESHAKSTGTKEIVLRAGGPQPEALAFYRAAGFEATKRFGRWVQDNTALCFRKSLD